MPVIAAETEGRRGKGEDGTASTREVKLCCLFTQTTVDKKGRPVRVAEERISSVQTGSGHHDPVGVRIKRS